MNTIERLRNTDHALVTLVAILKSDKLAGADLYDALERALAIAEDALTGNGHHDVEVLDVSTSPPRTLDAGDTTQRTPGPPPVEEGDREHACKVCHQAKPLDQFGRTGTGRLKTCRTCMGNVRRASAAKRRAREQKDQAAEEGT